MGRVSATLLALLVCLAAGAPSQDAERPMERTSIEGGAGAADWTTAEATATTSDAHAEIGDTSLLFHIDVNFQTGEAAYPIGWPRMYLDIPEGMRDWSDYDYLELSIHTESSRESLPSKGLGLILYVPDRENQYNRNLDELKVGETAHIVIPLSEVPRHDNVPRMQFFIAESEYKDGDVLDFYIDDIALTRLAEPAVMEVEPLQSITYADTGHIGVRFRLLGVKQGETAPVKARLRQGEQTLAEGTYDLARGTHEVWLPVATGPTPGEAELELYVREPQVVATIRIILGPFGLEGGGQ